MVMERTAIERAINAAGGQVALASTLGVTPQAISQWKKNGVPADRALAVQIATGNVVLCHELCPDKFPTPGDQPQRAIA